MANDNGIPSFLLLSVISIIISPILSKTAPLDPGVNSIFSTSYTPNKNAIQNVCATPGCFEAAARTLERMNLSANPCTDFYDFACGKFIAETKIPDDMDRVDVFTEINDIVQKQMLTMISEKMDPNDPRPFNIAKKLYNQCMDESSNEKSGKEPLINILNNRLGGWPVVDGDRWNSNSNWTWMAAIKEMRNIGYESDSILSVNIQTDLKNSTTKKIYISQADLNGLPRESLLNGFNDKTVEAYYKLMVDIAVMLGADRTRAEKELHESLDFEIKLANISMSSAELYGNFTASYNPMSLRELQQKYPYIKWVEYINALLPPLVSVDLNEVVVVVTPTYFEKLEEILRVSPPRTIANYLMWRVASYSSSFLTNDLQQRKLEFSNSISGKQGQRALWKRCMEITQSLPIAVGAMYVRKYFRADSKNTALEMVNQVRAEVEIILKEVHWMDEDTRQTALKKLHAISTYIGYADELMDDFMIEQFYENLQINENDYLSFVLGINVFDTDRSYGNLYKPENKTDWVTRTPPFVANAFYAPNQNGIQFPAAILQGQFFSADRPCYMNYGAIGVVIGHEITHGFDNQGRQFDLDGNLVNWWHPETEDTYLKRAKCIIEQYGNYTESTTGLKLNGIISQGENIADNGGTKEAYFAYLKWEKENGPEPKLPGVNFTARQMFWIAAAQNWCSAFRPELLRRQIKTDLHSNAQYRVIGPFSNRKEFANDFQCPVGSMMNPVKKCEVW